MARDDSGLDRRSVLRATGAAFAAGVAVTGTASATCYTYDVATLKYDYKLLANPEYSDDCAGDAVGPVEEAGTEFEVYDTCEDGNGRYVKVIPPNMLEYRWIPESAVECS